jgi:glucose-1-phosphate adenylyltransferase
MLSDVLAVIMGGGAGSRLWPLTQMRAKPAVPIAGKYRLIDIPMSNCLNSGIYHISILTQFLSVSLHRHITETYHFDHFHRGWVQILAAEQTQHSHDWYLGTADAVRKQIREIESAGFKYVLILAGDHLYRMDYRPFVERHIKTGAAISIAVKPVSREDARRFGVLRLDREGRCVAFTEKPQDPELIDEFVSRDDEALPLVGSTGNYIFNTDVLLRLLRDFDYADFGKDVLPAALTDHHVQGYEFDGYWEDIGTIRSFYEASLALTTPASQFDFHAPSPIYTHPRFLPCSITIKVLLDNVMLADGCWVEAERITHSIIGVRTLIADGAVIEDSIISGCDYYEHDRIAPEGAPPLGIGRNTHISGAIVDKNTRIGENVVVLPFPRGTDCDCEMYCVRDGIVVLPKHAIVPDGTRIAPE